MTFDPADNERVHAATQAWGAPLSLRQKRCITGCNTVVVNRNMKRWNGMCEKCFKAAAK